MNNCANCQKMSSCKLRIALESLLVAYDGWFTDPAEAGSETKEAIGKQCKKFLENGS